MKRRIICIDEEKCSGCGACAGACHEGAIAMVEGKARLVREDFCDGLGDCLPACPEGAITFAVREAPAYDEAAVQAAKRAERHAPGPSGGCPGSRASRLRGGEAGPVTGCVQSRLAQWPVQLKLVPVGAPYFDGADLLIAADCCAYACADFHQRFMHRRITLIGCPKLDEGDYAEKLTQIFSRSSVRSVTVTRMEVPCCGGIENAVKRALAASGRPIPLRVVTVSTDGRVLD